MTTVSQSNYAELFLLDLAFTDRVKTTNGILSPGTGKICSLTPHGASYINQSLYVVDRRDVTTRSVSWTPVTRPVLVMDTEVFAATDTALSGSSVSVTNTLFQLIDRLVFNYKATDTLATVEADLVTISDGSGVYVAGSASFSTSVVSTIVYNDDETTQQVSVPIFATLDVNLLTGTQTEVYQLKIYLSNDSWVSSYSETTIVSVVPPLDYPTLYTAPVATSTANIFSTATISTNLTYNTSQDPMSKESLSGITSFLVKLVDTSGSMNVPFNLLYKGRAPTVAEIRVAIRNAFVNSGTGSYDGWKSRAPNVFITSRFYLFPLWDKSVTKPTKKLYQDILELSDLTTTINQIALSVSVPSDITLWQVWEAAYNRMVIVSVADPTSTAADGTTPLLRLLTLFPDYQTCSSVDPDYAILSLSTQDMVKQVNYGLTQASGVTIATPYPVSQDGNLIYYSLVVDETELCLVTADGYTALMGVTS